MMTSVSVSTSTYTRTHTAAFVSDKLRTLLKMLVRDYGLNPEKVVDSWNDWVDEAARTWLISGHLTAVVMEFYKPGSDFAAARWDFPISYDGDEDDEDLWVDRHFFRETISKAKAPPSNCNYRIILKAKPGKPYVPGVGSTSLRSTDGLTARRQGTVISTRDIVATAKVYQ